MVSLHLYDAAVPMPLQLMANHGSEHREVYSQHV
jgi:hypothetical protein